MIPQITSILGSALGSVIDKVVPKTGSTVNTPIPQSLPNVPEPSSIATGRDLAKESIMADELGSVPANQDEANLFLRGTYTDAELKAMGIDPTSLNTAQGNYKQASEELLNTPQPSAGILGPLERALKVKGNIGNQPIGESEIFKSAGVGGYGALLSSIRANGEVMDMKYNNFAGVLQGAAGALDTDYKQVLQKYEIYRDEYKDLQDRMYKVIDNVVQFEQGIEKMKKQQELDKEMELWKSNLQDSQLSRLFGGSFKGEAGTYQDAISVRDTAWGGQCGEFVNDYTGLKLGDKFEDKMKLTDPSITTPQVGDVFVMPYSWTGHAGFIVGFNGQNAIVKDSNWGLDEKVQTHEIPISKMTGFIRPTKTGSVLDRYLDVAKTEGIDVAREQMSKELTGTNLDAMNIAFNNAINEPGESTKVPQNIGDAPFVGGVFKQFAGKTIKEGASIKEDEAMKKLTSMTGILAIEKLLEDFEIDDEDKAITLIKESVKTKFGVDLTDDQAKTIYDKTQEL